MSSTTSSARLRALILIGACVALLGFAGCGGDDDSAGDDSTTSTTEATGATGAEGSDTGLGLADFEAALAEDGSTEEQIDCFIENLNDADLTDEEEQAVVNNAVDDTDLPADLQSELEPICSDLCNQ